MTYELHKVDGYWEAKSGDLPDRLERCGYGFTPDEAVAHLYLALNKTMTDEELAQEKLLMKHNFELKKRKK